MNTNRIWRGLWLLAATTGVLPNSIAAQVTPPPGSMRSRQERKADAQTGFDRPLDARINAVIRKRLELTDDQFLRLRTVAKRMENERRLLRIEEGATRGALRRELLAGADANDSTVAAMLDRLPSLDRRRVDLFEREQGELAKFLTPVQRAKYIGLQDELRRMMEDLQRRRTSGDVQDGDSLGTGRPGPRRPFRPPVRR